MSGVRPGPGRPPIPAPGDGQDTLDGMADPEPYSSGPGSMSKAVAATIAAAKLDALDAALGALAVELGAAVDIARARRDPYGVAQASRELRTVLARLGLDPAARAEAAAGDGKGKADSEFDAFVAGLGAATMGDAAHT